MWEISASSWFYYKKAYGCSHVFPLYSWLDTDSPPKSNDTSINLATHPVALGNLFQGKVTGNTDLKIF